jgi:hypothetical protein
MLSMKGMAMVSEYSGRFEWSATALGKFCW